MREDLAQKNSRIYASSDDDDEFRAREGQVSEPVDVNFYYPIDCEKALYFLFFMNKYILCAI